LSQKGPLGLVYPFLIHPFEVISAVPNPHNVPPSTHKTEFFIFVLIVLQNAFSAR